MSLKQPDMHQAEIAQEHGMLRYRAVRSASTVHGGAYPLALQDACT